MQARFKNLGFGSKRKTSSLNIAGSAATASQTTIPQHQQQYPTNESSSTLQSQLTTTNSPHLNQNQLCPPPGAAGGAPVLPDPTASITSLQMNQPPNGPGSPPSYQYNPNAPRASSPMAPPPINTGYGQPQGGYPPQPPQYAGAGYQQQPPAVGQYGRPAEVEGGGRSNKAQLIVGIDFVSGSVSGTRPATDHV